MKNRLEDDDFYYNPDGYIVLTEQYHLDRGYCCGNGCKHCPFNYKNVPEPKRSNLIAERQKIGYKNNDTNEKS